MRKTAPATHLLLVVHTHIQAVALLAKAGAQRVSPIYKRFFPLHTAVLEADMVALEAQVKVGVRGAVRLTAS